MYAQLCLTLCDPMDWSPPGSSVHGIFQARILEWVAICFSTGSSGLRDQTHISLCLLHAGGFFTNGLNMPIQEKKSPEIKSKIPSSRNMYK